jgi:hypothetical protein
MAAASAHAVVPHAAMRHSVITACGNQHRRSVGAAAASAGGRAAPLSRGSASVRLGMPSTSGRDDHPQVRVCV